MPSADLLQWADIVGRRLADSAIRGAGQATWQVPIVNDDSPKTEPADGNLYVGTAGVALFLGELGRLTGDPRILTIAIEAIRWALEPAHAKVPNDFGLFAGRVGIAYAAHRVGTVANCEELCDASRAIVSGLAGKAHTDQGLDVIGGAAGAIPALLSLSCFDGFEDACPLAVALGDRLIERAHKTPDGWSWGSGSHALRDLTGYAHGAAGCGLALLEVAAATGDSRYEYAGHQAFRYERGFFDPIQDNWFDLRISQLTLLFYDGKKDEVKDRVMSGEEFTWPPGHSMTAWCHGAPGIGLTRLRAYELFPYEETWSEVEAAVRHTSRAILSRSDPNASLCHGSSGNSELLIVAAQATQNASLRRIAEDCLTETVERLEKAGGHWKTGYKGGRAHPSLMLGDAGIGHLLLRLVDPQTPSVLCLSPSYKKLEASVEVKGAQQLRMRDIERWFPTLLKLTDRTTVEAPSLRDSLQQDTRRPIAEVIAEWIGRTPVKADRERISEAAELDLAALALATTDLNLSNDALEILCHEQTDDVEWDMGMWQMSSSVRLIAQKHDWLSVDTQDYSPPTANSDHFVLLVCRNQSVTKYAIDQFAAVILAELRSPCSLDELIAAVAQHVAPLPEYQLRTFVIRQLREAHAARFVARSWQAATRNMHKSIVS